MWDGWERALQGSRVDGAVLRNFRRSLNKKSTENWGTRETPGPTLGLEPDVAGSCTGTAFEFPDDQRAPVEGLLTEREGRSFALVELLVILPDGREVRALTPVNDRTGRSYIGRVAIVERVAMARAAHGTSGTCAEYVRNIHRKLREIGIVDRDVEEFAALLDAAPDG